MSTSIGITGINGWIGGYISNYFTKMDYNVINLGPLSRSLEIGTENNGPPLIEWAFHFGASTSIKDSYNEPIKFYHNNISSTINLLKIVKNNNAKLIFMSSYVYGIPEYLPIDEDHPISITNPYMGSKYLSEQVCVQICDQIGIEYVVFRLFNVYAPGICAGRLVSDLLENVFKGGPLQLNDPLPERDYLYVKDLAVLLEKFTQVGIIKSGEVYNIGYGESFSNYDVLKIVEKAIDNKLSIKISNDTRQNDIMSIRMNPRKIMDDYQWHPAFDLASGINDIINLNKKLDY